MTLEKELTKKDNGGASGAEALILGVMLIMIIMFTGFFNILQNTASSRFEMLDGNLTASLLGVAKADLATYGDTNIIQVQGNPNAIVDELANNIRVNFGDTDLTDNPYRITNPTLFGRNGYMLVKEIVIVNTGTVLEPLAGDGELAFGKYTLSSEKFTLNGVEGAYSMSGTQGYPLQTGGVKAGAWDYVLGLPAIENELSSGFTLGGKSYTGIRDCAIGILVEVHYDMGADLRFLDKNLGSADTVVNRTRIVQLKRNQGK